MHGAGFAIVAMPYTNLKTALGPSNAIAKPSNTWLNPTDVLPIT
jgi:hypothetical protein